MPKASRPTAFRNPADDPLRPQNPLVTRRWISIAIGCMLVAAALAVYGALALLFWQGQWQLIFHPSHGAAETPAKYQQAYEDVRFGADESGRSPLHGWWIAADPGLRKPHITVLYIHEERGSLADALPDLMALHALAVDVFAFDPRGFGESAWAKPSEQRWNQDAAAALVYMLSVRHVTARDVVPIGRGLGGTVAANLTLHHPEMRSVVMIDPQPPTLALLEGPRWTHILPVRWLARDSFDPSAALQSSKTAKLFLTPTDAPIPTYIATAAAPKQTIPSALLGDAQTAPALHRFFEQAKIAP